MAYARAKIEGILKSFPQLSTQKGSNESLYYVLIEPDRAAPVPNHLIQERSFEWGVGYERKKTSMTDQIGDYCVYLYDQIAQMGNAMPGDFVRLEAIIYPIRLAVQKMDGRIKTGDIHLLTVPKMFFILNGSMEKIDD